MFTIEYRGFYIHDYCDKEECRFQKEFEKEIKCKSIHAAKCRIGRFISKKSGA